VPRGATEVRAIRVDLAPGEEAAAAGRVLSVGGRAATCNSDTDRDTTVTDGMPEVTETGARVPAVSTRVEGTDLLVDVEWPESRTPSSRGPTLNLQLTLRRDMGRYKIA
jgi:hypothetical protein